MVFADLQIFQCLGGERPPAHPDGVLRGRQPRGEGKAFPGNLSFQHCFHVECFMKRFMESVLGGRVYWLKHKVLGFRTAEDFDTGDISCLFLTLSFG